MGRARITKVSENLYSTIIGEQQHRVGIEFNTSFGRSQKLQTERMLDHIKDSKFLKNDREILNLQHSGNLILTDIRLYK